ncbi:CU044_2847 family protein [Streptomyces sp. NPDC057694]|uniref:CU044_2847 family protein n=1 Tax=unclassified Streptomyces TaxID=2593676 RepID=UPI00367A2E1F
MGAIQEIRLPDGTVVHARLSASESEAYGGDDQDIGVLDGAAAKVEQLGELVRGVGQSVLDAARAARPGTVTITFGVELAAKSGGALAVLASGEAKASIQVALGWSFDGSAENSGGDESGEGVATHVPDAPTGSD